MTTITDADRARLCRYMVERARLAFGGTTAPHADLLLETFARHREAALEEAANFQWPLGTRVRKRKGSSWQGRIVGTYSTSLTPEGYAVESEREPGSVQIYPVAALEKVDPA